MNTEVTEVYEKARIDGHGSMVADKATMVQRSGLLPRLSPFRGNFFFFGTFANAQLMLLALTETLTFAGVIYLATLWLNLDILKQPLAWVLLRISLLALIFTLCIAAMGLYSVRQRGRLASVLFRLAAAFTLGMLAITVLELLFPAIALGEGSPVIPVLSSLVSFAILRAVYYKFIDGNILIRRVLVLGTGKKAHYIDQLRRKSNQRGFNLVGFISPCAERSSLINPKKIISTQDNFCVYALANDIDEIVIALDDRRQGLPTEELMNCRMSGVDVTDILDFFERETSKIRLDLLQPSWLIHASGFKRNSMRATAKRLFDLIVGSTILVIFLPVMILVGLLIMIENGGRGSIFYHQLRVGRNGKPFRLYKFRSMHIDAEKDGKARWASENDPRITHIGAIIRKYRIDELPQLWNILKNDMSLVGPRPERPEFVAELSEVNQLYKERHRVNPGLAGWAQLCYPYGASEQDSMEKLQYDLFYVKNHRFMLDFYILLQTVEVVLFGNGSR